MAIEPADERILRAKYLDWCSARVADRFLELTPDQIYDLAHRPTARDSADAADAAAVPGAGAAEASRSVPAVESSVSTSEAPGRGAVEAAAEAGVNYGLLVARVTEVLAARLGLPSFEEWVSAYRKAPEQFEGELLGLWQREV